MCILQAQQNKCLVEKSKNISLFADTCYKYSVSGEREKNSERESR